MQNYLFLTTFASKNEVKKFLIVRFSSIGDIVLTSPVVRCLKNRYPNSEIHYVTKIQNRILLENNPYIDKVFSLESGLFSLAQQLRKEKYTHIIDLHNNIRSHLLTIFLFKPSKRFNKLNLPKWLLVHFKINVMPPIHIVDRYLKTLKFLGVTNDRKGLDFFTNESQSIPKLFHPTFKGKYIAWVIGGKHKTKVFPKERIRKIAALLNYPIVLLGDSLDKDNAVFVAQEQAHIINSCGLLSLQESALLVKEAALVLTNDTGLMHIAAAYKKKIIVFWGNTVPEFGMYPYMPDMDDNYYHSFEIKDLTCRPCSKIGFKKCPKGHFSCMEDIDIDDIVQQIEKMI